LLAQVAGLRSHSLAGRYFLTWVSGALRLMRYLVTA